MIDPIVDTEIGDKKQSLFYPQLKMKKWDNKANVSFRLDEPIKNARHEAHGIIDKWIDNPMECHFYNYLNGYEFGILLKKKPKRNYLRFTINTKHCSVYIQPELTKKEKAEGLFRPANVINSLALYSPFKNNQYGVGKIGHIYRPYVVDYGGVKEWCNFTYEGNGEVRLWLPPEILNVGKYPLWIDPTFGYTSAGASYEASENRIYGVQGTTGGTGGTIDKLTAYVLSNNSLKFRAGVYTESSDAPDSPVDTELTGVAAPNPAAWTDNANLAGNAVLASTNYYSCIWLEGGTGVIRIYYDNVESDSSYKNLTYSGGSWPDPFSETGGWTSRCYSIYTTYTEGGGGGGISIPVVMHHLRQQGIS